MQGSERALAIMSHAGPELSDIEIFELHRLFAREAPDARARARIVELAQQCLTLYVEKDSGYYLSLAGNYLELLGQA